MAIFVTLENTDGDVLARAFDIVHLQKYFRGRKEGHYLRFINDELDAVFNPWQIPFFRKELESIADQPQSDEERKELEDILAYCLKGEEMKNAYLKFYGDRWQRDD